MSSKIHTSKIFRAGIAAASFFCALPAFAQIADIGRAVATPAGNLAAPLALSGLGTLPGLSNDLSLSVIEAGANFPGMSHGALAPNSLPVSSRLTAPPPANPGAGLRDAPASTLGAKPTGLPHHATSAAASLHEMGNAAGVLRDTGNVYEAGQAIGRSYDHGNMAPAGAAAEPVPVAEAASAATDSEANLLRRYQFFVTQHREETAYVKGVSGIETELNTRGLIAVPNLVIFTDGSVPQPELEKSLAAKLPTLKTYIVSYEKRARPPLLDASGHPIKTK